jgi:predicted nuclease with RNAse H fold
MPKITLQHLAGLIETMPRKTTKSRVYLHGKILDTIERVREVERRLGVILDDVELLFRLNEEVEDARNRGRGR